MVLQDRAEALEERLRALDPDGSLESHLKELFDDVVDVDDAFPDKLTAVVDLQRRTLDAFAQLDAPPK